MYVCMCVYVIVGGYMSEGGLDVDMANHGPHTLLTTRRSHHPIAKARDQVQNVHGIAIDNHPVHTLMNTQITNTQLDSFLAEVDVVNSEQSSFRREQRTLHGHIVRDRHSSELVVMRTTATTMTDAVVNQIVGGHNSRCSVQILSSISLTDVAQALETT